MLQFPKSIDTAPLRDFRKKMEEATATHEATFGRLTTVEQRLAELRDARQKAMAMKVPVYDTTDADRVERLLSGDDVARTAPETAAERAAQNAHVDHAVAELDRDIGILDEEATRLRGIVEGPTGTRAAIKKASSQYLLWCARQYGPALRAEFEEIIRRVLWPMRALCEELSDMGAGTAGVEHHLGAIRFETFEGSRFVPVWPNYGAPLSDGTTFNRADLIEQLFAVTDKVSARKG